MWSMLAPCLALPQKTRKDTVEWRSLDCLGSQGTKIIIFYLHCAFCELFSINSLFHMFTDLIFCYPTPFWNTKAILELFGGFKKKPTSLHFKNEDFNACLLSQPHLSLCGDFRNIEQFYYFIVFKAHAPPLIIWWATSICTILRHMMRLFSSHFYTIYLTEIP